MRLGQIQSFFVVFIVASTAYGQPSSPRPAASAPVRFEEMAQRAGIDFTTHSSPTPQKNQPESMVGGIALLDYDRDGYLDIYVVNGAAIPSLQKEGPQYFNRLYHNNRDGTFTDVTEKAGVAGAGYGMGVAVGDYDNDGWPDIYLASVTGNQLFHNNGNGTFTDLTQKAGVGGGLFDGKKMWSVSAAWVDYDNDGLLDLFVTNYCRWEVNKDPVCMAGTERSYCDPEHYAPLPNTLYHNNGDGTFTDVSAKTGIAQHLGKGMGVAIADFDGDGFPDVFVANDKSPNFLFHNIGGKRFEEIGTPAMVAYSADGKPLSSMGVDFRDVNNDGQPDLWYTALEKETFPLLLYHRDLNFDDATVRSGVGWQTMRMSGWGNGIFDFDNDGWKDLFVARGHVLDNSDRVSGYPYKQPNSLLRNLGNGKFEDVSTTAGADFQVPDVHRGVAFGDLFNDGHVDAVVTALNGRLKVFRNVTQNSNHWIEFDLRGTKSNRMGIAARIHITGVEGKQQYNDVTTSVGYASSSDSRVHFGLGTAAKLKKVEILWPSGVRQVMLEVAADRIVSIDEPSGSQGPEEKSPASGKDLKARSH